MGRHTNIASAIRLRASPSPTPIQRVATRTRPAVTMATMACTLTLKEIVVVVVGPRHPVEQTMDVSPRVWASGVGGGVNGRVTET